MAQAKRKRRSGAKIATKREQGEVVAWAETLAQDPSILIPETDGRTPRPINVFARRLQRLSKARDSRLRQKLALKTGDRLSRAYANLLLVRQSGQAGRMASMRTPLGDLKYAVRGTVGPRHAVAVQHFRHPQVRILGYRELAQETGGIIWSGPERVHYTPKDAAPPQPWFDLMLPRLPLQLQHDDTGDGINLHCPHVDAGADPDDPKTPFGIALHLRPGPTQITACAECLHDKVPSGRQGILATLASYLIGLAPDKDVSVRTIGTPSDCVHDGPCAWVAHRPEPGKKTMELYRTGLANETMVLDNLLPKWRDAVKEAGDRLLVAGTTCYGADTAALLDELDVDQEQREAVALFIEAGPPVLMARDASLNQVLAACWEAAPKVLTRLHPDPPALEKMLSRHKESPPGTVLDEVLEARRAAQALAGYPKWDELSPEAEVADRLAAAHKVDGMEGLVQAIDRETKRGSHKGILHAGLRIADAVQGREWRFQQADKDAGEFLEQPLRGLLEAGPSDYAQALAQVHTLAGGAGELPAPKGNH